MAIVAPSLLAADFAHLARDCRTCLDAGAKFLHFDVMDGHFVPNISFGAPVLTSIAKAVPAFYDVHLMLTDPLDYVPMFLKAGASMITFHLEANSPVDKTIEAIHAGGAQAGIVIKPATPAEDVFPWLDKVEMVLVMSVEPGFGGQRFMAEQIQKIRRLREMGYAGHIQADGGVSLENLPLLREAGLDVAVLGTALYRSADPREDISRIHALP